MPAADLHTAMKGLRHHRPHGSATGSDRACSATESDWARSAIAAAVLAALWMPAALWAQPVNSLPLHPRGGVDDAPPALFRDGPFATNAVVGRIVVSIDRNDVPADGQSPVRISLRLFGRDGTPLAVPAFVTIEHSGGRLLLPGARTDEAGPRGRDADRAVPGVQLRVEAGRAEVMLLAPAERQDVRLRVTAGGETAEGVVRFVPELRPMLAIGLVEGVLTLRDKVALQPVRRGDPFEREIERWSQAFRDGRGNAAARAALYLKGTVRGDLLLTAAYDSDKEVRARLLRDIRPEEFYPVYGDSALRSFDARSAQRLYLRVDRDKSYVLYGDFVTGDGFSQAQGQGAVASLKQRSLGQYNRTATGLRAHHEAGPLSANAWVLHDSLRQVVEEFASQGSGPYALRNQAVLEGSEKVEIVVRDRHQPARIVSVQALGRLVDYSFEPFSGRILLAQFLPSVDADLNPVSLRVTYELDQGGDRFWVGGADAQFQLNDRIEVGGSLVEDRNGLAPYRLGSANVTLRLAPKTALVVEGATTRSTVNTNPTNGNTLPGFAGVNGAVSGKAARVELVHEDDQSQLRLYAGRSTPTFQNPAAPLYGGRGELLASGSVQLAPGWRVVGDALRSEDRNSGGGVRQMAGAGIRWQATERVTLEAGLRSHRETIGTLPNGTSSVPFADAFGFGTVIGGNAGGGALGLGVQALDPVTGLPIIQANGLPPAQSNLAPGSRLASETIRLGLGWQAGDRLRLGGEVEHDISGDAKRRIAIGAEWHFAERTRGYVRWERQSGWAQLQGVTVNGRSADALIVGIDSSVIRDTQLFSEYRLRDAASGRDLQLASGMRHVLDLAEGLRVSAALERTRVLDGSVPDANAVSLGLDWTAHDLWRTSHRVEWRRSGDIADTPTTDERFSTTLLQNMAARKLSRDWTFLARQHLLRTDFAARGGIAQHRISAGLAWRETDRNRVNALGKLEYKDERDASNAGVGELRSRAWIASAHADWHPSRPWWMSGRAAAKWQRDVFEFGVPGRFRAGLLAGRAVYDITERWDIGVLAAAQFGSAGAVQHAVGTEVGYLLRQNLWLSAGINASGFRGDADLTGYEYTQRGVYLRLRFKFDETLFKRSDREVNRTLDR
ncbi:MAG: hypothetical protein ACKVQR_20820 [Aquabacterium sp.]